MAGLPECEWIVLWLVSVAFLINPSVTRLVEADDSDQPPWQTEHTGDPVIALWKLRQK